MGNFMRSTSMHHFFTSHAQNKLSLLCIGMQIDILKIVFIGNSLE